MQETEKMPCVLSDHFNKTRYRKINYRKYSNTWRQNNTLLHDQWVTEEIKRAIKYLETSENENITYQSTVFLLGYSKDSAKRKVYSY
jgi:hypothetical protein